MTQSYYLKGKVLDKRDPQALGEALAKLKETYPNMSAPERADLLEDISHNYSNVSNGNGKK